MKDVFIGFYGLLNGKKKIKKIKKNLKLKKEILKIFIKKYCKDIIWLVWSVILEESSLRDNNIQEQIQYLFLLFKYDFTSGKRNNRLPLVYHSIGYLTLPIDFNIKIRKIKIFLYKHNAILI